MVKSQEISTAIGQVPCNKLIFASQFYRENMPGTITEESFYKTLERMCKTGTLCKLSKGTYYRPKLGRYGIVPPSEQEIVETFTQNKNGTIIGYRLYNQLNLTTQVPKRIEVLSSQLNQQSKTIRNIHITQHKLKYTEDVKSVIHMLEILKNFYSIEDINYAAFTSYCEKFSQHYCDEAAQYVLNTIRHQKCTISFLREILAFYHVSNTLDIHLSSLSQYKHPSMETIYEAASVS